MSDRRNIIRGVLAAFDGIHLDPAIPAKKLANARAACGVPIDEHVLGLIDCTIFGSAKQAVVFGERRVYVRDAWTGSCEGGIARVGYSELRRFDDIPAFEAAVFAELRRLDAIAGTVRTGRRDKLTRPTREVIEALRVAIDAAISDEPAHLYLAARPPDEPDASISPEATALQAAIADAPDDEGPQLVLADLLLATDDPRGELIVLHHREITSGLDDVDALERYLWLAAEYGFPHAFPEKPTLPFVGSPTGQATPSSRVDTRFVLNHLLRDYELRFSGHTLEVLVGGRVVLARRLRTQYSSEWSRSECAVILRTISDAILAGTPLKHLQFPFSDDPLPTYGGGAVRCYMLPRDYTGPRGIAPNRFGLAARDYERWMDTWRRLARSLKEARSA